MSDPSFLNTGTTGAAATPFIPSLPSSSNNHNRPPKQQSKKAYSATVLVCVGILLTIAHQQQSQIMQELFMGSLGETNTRRTQLRGDGSDGGIVEKLKLDDAVLSPQDWKELLSPRVDPIANYTWHNIPQKKPLNFVHIPKTGGTSMVKAGMEAGLNWGDCLFQYEWMAGKHDGGTTTCPQKPVEEWKPDDMSREGMGRVWWHVPIQHLPPQYANPYLGKDLFAVIRNPYDRAVSEFFYRCNLFPSTCAGLKDNNNNHDKNVKMLNEHIQVALKTWTGAARKMGNTATATKGYFHHWGHWIPQYHFFYNNKDQRMVQHLLHTELLADEFPSLLQAYGLQEKVHLLSNKLKQRGGEAQKLGVPQLTQTTLKLIEDVYQDDFALGGYRMISSKVPATKT